MMWVMSVILDAHVQSGVLQSGDDKVSSGEKSRPFDNSGKLIRQVIAAC